MAADAATDAASSVAEKGKGLVKGALSQSGLTSWSNLRRNFMITTTLAGIGAAAATGGATVPLQTLFAGAALPTAADMGFWNTVGFVGGEFVGNAWNGGAFMLGGAQDIAMNADWSGVGSGIGQTFGSLAPTA